MEKKGNEKYGLDIARACRTVRCVSSKRGDENPILAATVNSDEKITPVGLSNERREYWKLYFSEVDKKMLREWIKRAIVLQKTKQFMCALQDQIVSTNNYGKMITESWNSRDETVQYILNGSRTLVASEYKSRYDADGKVLHQEILRNTYNETE